MLVPDLFIYFNLELINSASFHVKIPHLHTEYFEQSHPIIFTYLSSAPPSLLKTICDGFHYSVSIQLYALKKIILFREPISRCSTEVVEESFLGGLH
jgi:hypothetical protein